MNQEVTAEEAGNKDTQSQVNDRESVLIEQKSPKSKPKVVVPSPVGKSHKVQDVNF